MNSIIDHLAALVAGAAAIVVGVLDVETTLRLGTQFDIALIVSGLVGLGIKATGYLPLVGTSTSDAATGGSETHAPQ